MDLEKVKNNYEKMPIDELAYFLESYNEDDFTPEVQKVIEEVIEVRKNELNDYHEQKANYESADEIDSKDREKGGPISRKVTCKNCSFKGVVEAHDTQHYPESSVFKVLGKDHEGYIYLRCPSCDTDISYSPFEFLKL